MLRGYVINGSPCVLAGGRLHRMPATRQPVREWVAELAALTPRPHCGARGGCDCLDWLEWMAAANNNAAALEMGENHDCY